MNNKVYVEMKNISKSFGSVIANNKVNFKVNKGEIHALLGENGAGKSTLMNMLSGIYIPDSGSILIDGKEVNFTSPKESIDIGIGMIHQHYKLVDVLTAKENIILGQKGNLFIKNKDLTEEIQTISDKFGLNINPDKKIYEMSVGEKQTVEIVKVLYRGADILVLDEPTAVLTPQETKKLFQILENMKNNGCSVIIITHKLNEVMEISDRVTVLRKGEAIETVNTKETSPKELTNMMVGRSVNLEIERVETKKDEVFLKLENLTVLDNDKVAVLDNISFDLYSSEILGVAGVAGSGQKELCEAIAGLCDVKNGKIFYKNENLVGKSPREIIKKGVSMSFIPEDRLGMGLVASMDMVDNFLLKEYHLQKGFFIQKNSIKEKCKMIIDKLSINTPGVNHPIKQLSGGNIQKVLLGREIDCNPQVLITAYPIRGLDIGATHTIYDILNEQKSKGVAILYVGEDLDVLMELCDRIVVMCDGKVTGIVEANKTTKEELGFMMAGQTERQVVANV